MREKLKNVGWLVSLFFFLLIFLGIESNILAQSWFDPDWDYRMSITIDNTENPTGLTDYQVRVQLNSSNFDFSKTQSKGEDIRFTEGDGTTLMNHWTEYWNSVAESALVWIKLPNVPSSDSTSVFMYYGNPNCNTSTNGTGTFEFFDDFESDSIWANGWTVKAPLPLVKADNAAAVHDNLLYTFGGYDRNPTTCARYYLDETFVYNPTTDTWTQLADMPTARWGAVAVEFDGLIHLFAGEAVTGTTAVHEVYDPGTNSWSTWSNVPAQLADQGGMGISYGNKIHLFLKQYHYEYDPATDTYTPKANVPTPRTWGTCALVSGLIYIVGGYSYGAPSGATNANEVYDPATDSWITRAPMPVKKFGATRENPVIGGKIYVTHGRDGMFYADNYVYDPSTDTWELNSSAVYPRDGVGCGVINNRLYVVGGRDLLTCSLGIDYVEEYDPAADKIRSNPWVISNTSVIKRDSLAKYEGAYGFFFDKTTVSGDESAQHLHNLTTCAVDLYWNVTDYLGLALNQPQGAFLLTADPEDGSLLYYNNGGSPEFSWYTGSYNSLQSGVWNNWYSATIIWNGSNSKVILNGAEHNVSARATNSDRVSLRVNKLTRQYFDLVRVRKYSFPEPGVTPGPVESINHPPVLTLQDSSFFLCEPESISFNLLATDPDSADILTIEKLSGPGDFTSEVGPSPLNATHSFLPEHSDSTYLFVFTVTDAKGAFDQESTYVHLHFNQSPILILSEYLETLLCNSGDSIYLPIKGEDPDSGQPVILEKVSSKGELLPSDPLSGNSPLLANFLWKPDYSDTLDNPHQIIFKLKDLCGQEIQDTLIINVKFNHLPILILPADTVYDLCLLDTICFDRILSTDPDTDDSAFITKVSDPGDYNPNTGLCCFLPLSESTYTFIFQAQDLCGATVLDTFNLTVALNQTPSLALPGDTAYRLCTSGDSIFFEFFASDVGDSLTLTKLSSEGELRPFDPLSGQDSVRGAFVWKPDYPDTISNPHLLIFQAKDNCGFSKTDTVRAEIEFNHPPVLSCEDSAYSLCEDSTVCFDNLLGTDSDPDDSLRFELVSGPECLFLTTMISPTFLKGSVCFLTTGTDSIYSFVFSLTDKCGEVNSDTVYIEISPPADLLRGDPSGDRMITVSDIIYIINYLFRSGPPPVSCTRSGDVNCDSKVTVSDVIFLINYLFKGGPPPSC